MQAVHSGCPSLPRLQCALLALALAVLLLDGNGGGRRGSAQLHCPRALAAPAATGVDAGTELARLRQAYITAVRDSLTGVHLETPAMVPGVGAQLKEEPFSADKRGRGVDWPK